MSHPVVSHEQWLTARKTLLLKEKEFTRTRDALSAARRDLPWMEIEKPYVFEGPQGEVRLADLFAGRSQLMVYHFMLAPGWVQGCPSCSFLADHFDGAIPHLAQRDVTMVAVSRAPLAEIRSYQKRMGWTFPWVSSYGSDFNRDFGVTFIEDGRGPDRSAYNYGSSTAPGEEMPGLSVFTRDDAGHVFKTYSTYGRGLDLLIGTYNLLDMVPKGRDETRLPWSMAWVKRHDEYEETSIVAKSCCCG